MDTKSGLEMAPAQTRPGWPGYVFNEATALQRKESFRSRTIKYQYGG
jgi:hypothetical protein